jgi:hypothetical protein
MSWPNVFVLEKLLDDHRFHEPTAEWKFAVGFTD